MADQATMDIFNASYETHKVRDIWENSQWGVIAKLGNNDVGKSGEQLIQLWCDQAGIKAEIDGLKTKGGSGDGLINGKTVEIKTARENSDGSAFQHELGEHPWKADFMLFLDISPNEMYITIFPNFSEPEYKEGRKCVPYFPTKKVIWRKGSGAFKLDTTVKINQDCPNTFRRYGGTSEITFCDFVNSIIRD